MAEGAMRIAEAAEVLAEFRAEADPTLLTLLAGYMEGLLERWPGQFRHEMEPQAERRLREACNLTRRRLARQRGQ